MGYSHIVHPHAHTLSHITHTRNPHSHKHTDTHTPPHRHPHLHRTHTPRSTHTPVPNAYHFLDCFWEHFPHLLRDESNVSFHWLTTHPLGSRVLVLVAVELKITDVVQLCWWVHLGWWEKAVNHSTNHHLTVLSLCSNFKIVNYDKMHDMVFTRCDWFMCKPNKPTLAKKGSPPIHILNQPTSSTHHGTGVGEANHIGPYCAPVTMYYIHISILYIRLLGSLIPVCERQVCLADVSVRVLWPSSGRRWN